MSKIRRIIFILSSWVFLIGNAFAVAPENGWWWNPSESGSGYAIERQGSSIFMAAFLYESSGAATWYATLLTLQPDGTYKGDMTRYVGGKSLLGAYKAPSSTSVVATATATFPKPDSGTMTIAFPNGAPNRTIPISRFAFASPSFEPSKGSFQNGWWWNDQESGTGYFVEVQGDQAFIASFMYDTAGQPTWYASLASLTGTNLLSGALDMYANGQPLGGAYKAPTANSGGAGSMSYSFTSNSVGTMTLPNNGRVSISRFPFDPSALTNHPPVPNAGPNQTVYAGDSVNLNGTATDADGDTLTFAWKFLTAPDGSKAVLAGSTTSKPSFVPDIAGTYRFSLIVDDGKASNGQSVVVITAVTKSVSNIAPVANAGSNQSVTVGASVSLNGNASTDANGDALTYSWFFVTKPSGSSASLSGATSVSPSFTADVAGSYVIGLTVNDGKVSSSQSSVTVTATATAPTNIAPVANAGSNQSVTAGASVTLNGSSSSDANGDALTYSWSFISKPSGSSASLSGATSVSPSFTADVAGSYVIGLTVNDGKVSSSQSSVTVTATSLNRAPVANAGGGLSVNVGTTILLNGTGSYDPDGDPIAYSWAFYSKPAGSTAVLLSNTTSRPSFTPDIAGTYIVALAVSDGKLISQISSVTLTATNPSPPPSTIKHYLYGGLNNSVYLGCLNCNSFDTESVCNSFGTYGSSFANNSIWNQFGTYGSSFNSYSPWNSFSLNGPVIIGSDLLVYGYFTTNSFKTSRTSITSYLNVLNYFNSTNNLSATRTYACGN